MLVKIYDKILFGLGLVVLGSSYFFLGRITPDASSGISVPITVPKPYEPAAIATPKLEQVRWADAKAQPAGPKWIYDLFTPPLIFLDTKTATLSPEPPKQKFDTKVLDRLEFPFVLVDITRDLYRIQLSGFFGQAPDFRVTLEDRESSSALIGKAGTRFEKANIELKSFNVERRTTNQGGTPLVEEIATAVILDLLTNEEITLVSPGDPRYLATGKAEFRTRDDVPVNFVLRQGESKKFGDFNFSVRDIAFATKTVTVVRDPSADIPEVVKEMKPTPKEELPTVRPPSIQGGAPSDAPFMRDPNSPEAPPWARPQNPVRPGQRPAPDGAGRPQRPPQEPGRF